MRQFVCDNKLLLQEWDYDRNIIDPYKTCLYSNKKVFWRCKSCGHKWSTKICHRANGSGCPLCAGRVCVSGFNDIITQYENEQDVNRKSRLNNLIQCFLNKNDASSYTPSSSKCVLMKCKDCNSIDKKIIYNVFRDGFACNVCGSGISYPNKFIYAFTKQLPVNNVTREWNDASWLKSENGGKYSFDVYFAYINKQYVIEADGELGHGNRRFKNNQKDVDGKARDDIKDKRALENNIEVIRIDCKESNMNYIKTNILNSTLNDLFDLTNIDWDECEKFARTNLLKDVCKYYNDNKFVLIKDLSKMFSVSTNTIARYLSIGNEIGWCTYNPKEQVKQSAKTTLGKMVIQLSFDDVEIYRFKSGREAGRILNINASHIHECCKGIRKSAGGFHWKYVDKIQQNDLEVKE